MSNVIHVDFGKKRSVPKDSVVQARFTYDSACILDETDLPAAEKLYRRAVELDPKYALAYTNLGRVRFLRGDIDEAEHYFRRAAEIDPYQPEAHYNLGFVLLERGWARESVPCFQRAIHCDPKFADAHYNLALAFDRLGECSQARRHVKEYLALEPSGPWADAARAIL